MKSLAILGASGHGKVLADIALVNGFESIQFFDDCYPELQQLETWPISGNTDTLLASVQSFSAVIVGIGHNQTRLAKQTTLENAGAIMATLIHPKAIVSQFASIKPGSVVMAGAVLSAFATLGRANIINTAATVDHDCKLADGVHISPGANLAGAVSVGTCTWVGLGACVIQCLKIGANVIVGAGSTVIHSTIDNIMVVGSPAKQSTSLL
ncbi:acetyltransferase [Shewanella sp. VB17]|uniref:acetyltransferase n=1 Tax=Shewanella sp. VB17 TaxID=2739432 RepID=UPI00156633C4|nr:acetyltransferase [Shewanella sp. VB17]NRD74697.1 acetyltransferase [Shewanella sp. VB17]